MAMVTTKKNTSRSYLLNDPCQRNPPVRRGTRWPRNVRRPYESTVDEGKVEPEPKPRVGAGKHGLQDAGPIHVERPQEASHLNEVEQHL